MNSESGRRLSLEELKQLNRSQSQVPPKPPAEPARQDRENLLAALTALYRLESTNSSRLERLEAGVSAQEALFRALSRQVGQLPTQSQLEALARDVAQMRAELKQAGKKKELSVSPPSLETALSVLLSLIHISLPPEYSQLYLAIEGVLSAVICISDPLREEAKDVLSALRGLGVKNAVMLTGDSPRTAAAIAAQLGVDDFQAGVLPADKADYVAALRREGHTVLMVGDGINDSPALSEADAGIAISDGAAIAREIADITIAADSLWELVRLRQLAMALMHRIQNNYRFVIGFNGVLIGLGVAGILPPATSAMLHNLSTLGVSLHSMSALPVAGRETKVVKDL